MEIPTCVRHKRSTVVRAGWYGREGQRRQLWWCRPAKGDKHRFTEPLPRITTGPHTRHTCTTCETVLEPWEGTPAPRLYGFSAADIAWALSLVATGDSYRNAAARVRERAGRELPGYTPDGGLRNRHPQLVSDWVDTFAPVIWNNYAPTVCSEVLVVDDKEFRYAGAGPRGQRAFGVMVAMGSKLRPSWSTQRPFVAAVAASKTLTKRDWTRFYNRFDGAPTLAVGDAGIPLRTAGALWPDTVLRRCRWHLKHNINRVVPTFRMSDAEVARYRELVDGALSGINGWEALQLAAVNDGFTTLSAHLARLDHGVRDQFTHVLAQQGPHSNGAAEHFLAELTHGFKDRAHMYTNKTKTDAVLTLTAARYNQWGDERDWARIITTHLRERKGHALAQRRHTDPAHAASLR